MSQDPVEAAPQATTRGDRPGHPHGHEHGHELHTTSEMVVLANLADALIADLHNHPAGRTARTVMTGTVMRVTMIALAAGTELAEHDSPTAATLQLITGKVTLRAGDQEWPIYPGQLMAIPPQRHSVLAHADSAVLLTVALR